MCLSPPCSRLSARSQLGSEAAAPVAETEPHRTQAVAHTQVVSHTQAVSHTQGCPTHRRCPRAHTEPTSAASRGYKESTLALRAMGACGCAVGARRCSMGMPWVHVDVHGCAMGVSWVACRCAWTCVVVCGCTMGARRCAWVRVREPPPRLGLERQNSHASRGQ